MSCTPTLKVSLMKGTRNWTVSLLLAFLLVLGAGGAVPLAAQDSNKEEAKEDSKAKEAKDDVEAIGERNVSKGMNFYSLEEEIQMGKAMAAQVEQQSRMVQDPVVAEYINRLGQNIVRNSDAQVPFTIKVIESDEWNAFALPGGFFYVHSGLVLAAESEAELAGVMAHEIAHVAARHGTKQASKAELANWLSLPLIFLGGPVGFGARSAAGLLIPMKFLQFSRGAEREADYLGLQYLYKSGYDPESYPDFFEKLQAREKNRPGSLAKAFSTHPMTPDRIAAAEDEIKTILPPRDEYVVTTGEFDRVVGRLRQLHARGRVDEGQQEADRPTLRRKTTAPPVSADGTETSTDGTTTDGSTSTDTEEQPRGEDERPTLRRR